MTALRAVRPAIPILVAPVLALSCGGPPSAPQAPAVQIVPATPPAAPAPDLSAVPDPSSLVVSGRLTNPGASLSMVHGWSSLPTPQSEEVTELVMGEAVGPLVDLDQPIDFAVAVVGSGTQTRDRTAVSAALKDVDRAKAMLSERYKLVAVDHGVLLIQVQEPGARHDDDTDGERRACEIAPAYGAAPMRLVCGLNAKALSDLAPWLTRTKTRLATAPDVDLRVDLHMQPLRPNIASEKRFIGSVLAGIFGARFELPSARLLASSVVGDVIDFALDLDTASLDVKLAPSMGTANATLTFSGKMSALARLATAHPERNDAVPAAFWQLPGDADFAFFDRGIDEAVVARGRELVLHVVGEGLAEIGVKDADRKAIVDALGKLTSSAPMAYASGLDSNATGKALATERSLSDGSDPAALVEARRASVEALLGWRVFELDEPSTRLTDAIRELAGAWGRPAVAAAYRAKAKGAASPTLRVAPIPKGVTLPASAQHDVFEIHLFDPPPSAGAAASASTKPKPPSKPVVIHIFVVPDGTRTWVGIGSADTLVASKLAASIGAASDTLAASSELKMVRSLPSVGAGGFVTVRGLAEAPEQVEAMLGGRPGGREHGFEEVAGLPHGAAVPIAFALTAQSDGAPSSVIATLSVSRAAIEDIVAAIQRHGF